VIGSLVEQTTSGLYPQTGKKTIGQNSPIRLSGVHSVEVEAAAAEAVPLMFWAELRARRAQRTAAVNLLKDIFERRRVVIGVWKRNK